MDCHVLLTLLTVKLFCRTGSVTDTDATQISATEDQGRFAHQGRSQPSLPSGVSLHEGPQHQYQGRSRTASAGVGLHERAGHHSLLQPAAPTKTIHLQESAHNSGQESRVLEEDFTLSRVLLRSSQVPGSSSSESSSFESSEKSGEYPQPGSRSMFQPVEEPIVSHESSKPHLFSRLYQVVSTSSSFSSSLHTINSSNSSLFHTSFFSHSSRPPQLFHSFSPLNLPVLVPVYVNLPLVRPPYAPVVVPFYTDSRQPLSPDLPSSASTSLPDTPPSPVIISWDPDSLITKTTDLEALPVSTFDSPSSSQVSVPSSSIQSSGTNPSPLLPRISHASSLASETPDTTSYPSRTSDVSPFPSNISDGLSVPIITISDTSPVPSNISDTIYFPSNPSDVSSFPPSIHENLSLSSNASNNPSFPSNTPGTSPLLSNTSDTSALTSNTSSSSSSLPSSDPNTTSLPSRSSHIPTVPSNTSNSNSHSPDSSTTSPARPDIVPTQTESQIAVPFLPQDPDGAYPPRTESRIGHLTLAGPPSADTSFENPQFRTVQRYHPGRRKIDPNTPTIIPDGRIILPGSSHPPLGNTINFPTPPPPSSKRPPPVSSPTGPPRMTTIGFPGPTATAFELLPPPKTTTMTPDEQVTDTRITISAPCRYCYIPTFPGGPCLRNPVCDIVY